MSPFPLKPSSNVAILKLLNAFGTFGKKKKKKKKRMKERKFFSGTFFFFPFFVFFFFFFSQFFFFLLLHPFLQKISYEHKDCSINLFIKTPSFLLLIPFFPIPFLLLLLLSLFFLILILLVLFLVLFTNPFPLPLPSTLPILQHPQRDHQPPSHAATQPNRRGAALQKTEQRGNKGQGAGFTP